MIDPQKPLTITEIKRAFQETISLNARAIDKNNQTIQYNNGESKWPPAKKGGSKWLRVSTDKKRHVMIWTIAGNAYMKSEARKLADRIEEAIKIEFNQTVPIEFQNAPVFTVTSTGPSVCIYRGQEIKDDGDDCPF